ncbi:MAG: DUF2384 domain-containing protein [Siphonobacter sp.]
MTHGTISHTAVYAPYAVIDKSRQGILRSEVDQLATTLKLTDKEMARLLNMSERNLHRLKSEDRLSRDSSERLLLLSNLLHHGLDVFDQDTDLLSEWLRTPLRELHHQSPIQLLDTATGFSLVEDVLIRIEYGLVG